MAKDPYKEEKKMKNSMGKRTRKLFSGNGKELDAKKYGDHTEEYWVKYVQDRMKRAQDYRTAYYDKNWLINWTYYLGLTNLRYNKITGTLDWDYKDPLKYNINEIYAIVRAIRGALTRTQPIWDVDVMRGGTLSSAESDTLGNFMDHLWKKLGMKKKTKESVLEGLVASIGVFQYGFDSDEDEGEGELWVDVVDTFDFYIDPSCGGNFHDGQFVYKIFNRNIEELKNDDMYMNTENISTDNKVSPSEYKEQLESKLNPQSTNDNKMGSVLGCEMYCKYKDDNGEERMRLITILPEQGKLIRFVDGDEMDDYESFPFEEYQPDINPNRVYSEGWVKNLVPLQRMLNDLERNTAEYNRIFSKGRFITTPNSGVKVVTDQNGQIITKNPGATFEQQDIKPMSATVFKQVDNIRSYLQEIGAANEAFMGKTPTGITSGVAIETLVANNMVNLADLVDNLEICLGRLGTALLRLGAKKYSVTKEFKIKSPDGERQVFKVIGSEDPQGLANGENVVRIPENPQVRVVINSGIAYTKQGRQEILQNMRNGGDVDRRTFLEEMGDFDVDKIEARLAQERAGMPITEDGMKPGEMPMQPGAEGGVPQAGGQGSPLQGMNPKQLADFLEKNGLTLDPVFDDPEQLRALLAGEIPFDIIDNVIVPAPPEAPLQ